MSGEDCGDFVVYTTMTVITNAGAYPVRLDGDCEHLSPVPESASPPASKPDPVASELERQRQQLEQQQRER